MLGGAEHLPRFDRPALVIWANEDRVMPPEHGRRCTGVVSTKSQTIGSFRCLCHPRDPSPASTVAGG